MSVSIMLSANGDVPSTRIPEVSSLAEQRGFGGVWFGETTLRDAAVLAAVAACSTKKIEIGTSIVNSFTRSPGQLAMMGATLNELSGGRFSLGLGVSTAAIVQGWHGQRFEAPAERLEEVVKLVRQYCSGERFSFQGAYFSPANARLRVGTPPRIALAALNDGMVRRAASLGDRVILNLYPVERIAHARRLIDEASRAAGKGDRPVLSVMLYAYVLGDDEKGLQAAKDLVSFYSSAPAYAHLFSSVGFADEARGMLEGWKNRDREAVRRLITREMIDKMMLLGTVKELRERVRLYHGSGVDDVFISPSPFGDYQANVNEVLVNY